MLEAEIWGGCIALAIVALLLTFRWIARDRRLVAAKKLKPLVGTAAEARLDESETMMNLKLEELQGLHQQSISKGLRFDPNYVPPPAAPACPLDAKNDELRKMAQG